MVILQRPDKAVSALLGENKGLKKGDVLKPTQFALIFDHKSRRVLYNTFTGICVSDVDFMRFESDATVIYDPDDEEIKALANADLLVADDIDEAERYGRIISIQRKMIRVKPGYTSYTILPTTACNARCSYCYEAGIPFETMDEAMTEKVIGYIRATRREGADVVLSWFGGEPLIGEKVIDDICSAMRSDGVNYSSSMISNGSLFSEKMVRKAVNDWCLSNIQITLDGREDEYCRRKRYVSFEGSPYRAVLDGIKMLLGRNVSVSVRLNVDEENLQEMYALADELEDELAGMTGISIYSHGIFEDEKTGAKPAAYDVFYDKLERLNNRLYEFNQKHRSSSRFSEEADNVSSDAAGHVLSEEADHVSSEGEDHAPAGYLRRYFCMADSPWGSPVITPNGEMFICEHIGELPVAGNIEDMQYIDRDELVRRERLSMKRCRECALLPVCTDFSGCPVISRDCFREMKAAERSRLFSALGDQPCDMG